MKAMYGIYMLFHSPTEYLSILNCVCDSELGPTESNCTRPTLAARRRYNFMLLTFSHITFWVSTFLTLLCTYVIYLIRFSNLILCYVKTTKSPVIIVKLKFMVHSGSNHSAFNLYRVTIMGLSNNPL